MKKKSLFAVLLMTIVLISSCIMGVAENESASVSFKLETASSVHSMTTARSMTTSTRNQAETLVISIIDAKTRRVIATKTVLQSIKSYTFDVIPIGLTVIGEVVQSLAGDLPMTYRSLPYTITDGENNIVVSPIAAVVYLNPTANDGGDGTETSPVKTMTEAITLSSGGTIWVMDTISVTSAETWSNNVTLKRYGDNQFRDTLIEIDDDGSLTLENITIDGQGGVNINGFMGEGNIVALKSLITVKDEGSLTLKTGAILQNSNAVVGSGEDCGSAVNVDGGELLISGGTIRYNRGNICGIFVLNSGKLKMTGGSIIDNFADLVPSAPNGSYGAVKIKDDNNNRFELGAGTAIKIINNIDSDYIPKNLEYVNDRFNVDGGPWGGPLSVEVTGNLANGTRIGLNPELPHDNIRLVSVPEQSDITINPEHFYLMRSGIETKLLFNEQYLVLKGYEIGGEGLNGGYVFPYNDKWYEISEDLTGGPNNNGKFTWDQAMNQTTWNGSLDWELPSKEVLNAAYDELYAPGKFLHDNSLPNTYYCWSSTAFDANNAYLYRFFEANPGLPVGPGKSDKANNCYVKVVQILYEE